MKDATISPEMRERLREHLDQLVRIVEAGREDADALKEQFGDLMIACRDAGSIELGMIISLVLSIALSGHRDVLLLHLMALRNQTRDSTLDPMRN